MTTLYVTVNMTKADIGETISGLMAAANAVGPVASRGRGRVRLCNVDDNGKLFLALQDDEPSAAVRGIPVNVGAWFPHELDIVSSGGIWAWSNRDNTKVAVWVTAWSA